MEILYGSSKETNLQGQEKPASRGQQEPQGPEPEPLPELLRTEAPASRVPRVRVLQWGAGRRGLGILRGEPWPRHKTRSWG